MCVRLKGFVLWHTHRQLARMRRHYFNWHTNPATPWGTRYYRISAQPNPTKEEKYARHHRLDRGSLENPLHISVASNSTNKTHKHDVMMSCRVRHRPTGLSPHERRANTNAGKTSTRTKCPVKRMWRHPAISIRAPLCSVTDREGHCAHRPLLSSSRAGRKHGEGGAPPSPQPQPQPLRGAFSPPPLCCTTRIPHTIWQKGSRGAGERARDKIPHAGGGGVIVLRIIIIARECTRNVCTTGRTAARQTVLRDIDNPHRAFFYLDGCTYIRSQSGRSGGATRMGPKTTTSLCVDVRCTQVVPVLQAATAVSLPGRQVSRSA